MWVFFTVKVKYFNHVGLKECIRMLKNVIRAFGSVSNASRMYVKTHRSLNYCVTRGHLYV